MASTFVCGFLIAVLTSAAGLSAAQAQDTVDLSALPAKLTEFKDAKAKYESRRRDMKSYQDVFDMKNKVLEEQVAKLREYEPQIQSFNSDKSGWDAEAARHEDAVRQHEQSCAGVKARSPQAAACRAKATELNAWKDRLESEGGRLNSRRSLLDNSMKALQENIEARRSELEPIKEKYRAAEKEADDNATKANSTLGWAVVARKNCLRAVASASEPDKTNCLAAPWGDFGLPAIPRPGS